MGTTHVNDSRTRYLAPLTFLLLGVFGSGCMADVGDNHELEVAEPEPSRFINELTPWTGGEPPPPRQCPTAFSGGTIGVHEVINQAGYLFNRTSDNLIDASIRDLVDLYWTGKWGRQWLASYGVYSVVRAAVEHRGRLSTDTRFQVGCMVRDFEQNPDVASPFHGNCGTLGDTCSEDYMGHALGFAAVDSWRRNTQNWGTVTSYVTLAFSVGPDALEYDGNDLVLYNHNNQNPVYGMAVIMHLLHIKKAYEAADLSIGGGWGPDGNIRDLYYWIHSKIEPTTGLFLTDACSHAFNAAVDCRCNDERHTVSLDGQNYVCNIGGDSREPHHYPMAEILSDLGVPAADRAPFGYDCVAAGQNDYNQVFNCYFSKKHGSSHY